MKLKLILLTLLLPLMGLGQVRQSGGISFTPQFNFKISGSDTTWQFGNTLMSPAQYPYLLTKWQSDQRYAPIAGGGYVPNSRTLTINGVTYDLSANRTWSIIPDTSHTSTGLATWPYIQRFLTQTDALSTYVQLGGSYANPGWITSLAYSKLTGAPSSLPPTGTAGGVLSGTYPNPGLAQNISLNGGTSNSWNTNWNSIEYAPAFGNGFFARNNAGTQVGMGINSYHATNGGNAWVNKVNGNSANLLLSNTGLDYYFQGYKGAGASNIGTSVFRVDTLGNITNSTWNGTTISVANGGTGTGTAGITAINNITGRSYTGFTGTGNLVGSASPTFTGTVGAAAITASGAVTAGSNLIVKGSFGNFIFQNASGVNQYYFQYNRSGSDNDFGLSAPGGTGGYVWYYNSSGAHYLTSLNPDANNTYDLGSSSFKWANAYATTFNGALNGTINSTTTGITQSAGDNSQKMATTGYVDNGLSGKAATLSGTTDYFSFFSSPTTIAGSDMIRRKVNGSFVTLGLGQGAPGINDPATDNPHLLEINNDGTSQQVIKITTAGSGASYYNNMHWNVFDGTFASPTNTKANMFFMSMGYRGWDNTNGASQSAGAFQAETLSDWTATSHPIRFNFDVTNTGSITRTSAFQIRENSDVWGAKNLIVGQSDKQPWNAAYTTITMAGNQGLRSQSSQNNSMWFNNLYYDSSWKYAANGYGSFLNLDENGALIFGTAPSGTAGASATLTNWLTITNTGNATLSKSLNAQNYYSTSTTPSISAGAGAGTSPTLGISGTNQDGIITITVGTLPSAGSKVMTVTMSGGFAYPSTCIPILTYNGAPVNNHVYITNVNATSFEAWSDPTGVTAGLSYQFYYHNGGF